MPEDEESRRRDALESVVYHVWQSAEGPTHFDQAVADALLPVVDTWIAEAEQRGRDGARPLHWRSRPPIEDYSRALDEIYELRRALAYEAQVLRAHLELKGFPTSRRPAAERSIERMRLAAQGHVTRGYHGIISSLAFKAALKAAGARTTLTRTQWENETGTTPTTTSTTTEESHE